MKSLAVGDLVRLNNNLHGHIVILEELRAKIEWHRTRGKGTVVRTSDRWFPSREIFPSDEADFNAGLPWRLQFFIEDGRGKAVPGNSSRKSERSQMKLWQPYSP